jgi:hypothetical protein
MAFLFISGENSVHWRLSATRSFHYFYAAIADWPLIVPESGLTLVPREEVLSFSAVPSFVFEFLDSPGGGWGGNMTLLSRAAKIQIFAYGKKVPYLMHFRLAAS